MTPEVAQAMMKEWYWGVIMLALILVAFAPSFLKAKCPGCGKRSLRSVEIVKPDLVAAYQSDNQNYTTFYRCDGCKARFNKVRTGALEDASDSRFDDVFQSAPGSRAS